MAYLLYYKRNMFDLYLKSKLKKRKSYTRFLEIFRYIINNKINMIVCYI